MLDPTAMFSAISMRLRIAISTAELFSAALPMIGTRIKPTKNSVRPRLLTAISVADTRTSAITAMPPAAKTRVTAAFLDDHLLPPATTSALAGGPAGVKAEE